MMQDVALSANSDCWLESTGSLNECDAVILVVRLVLPSSVHFEAGALGFQVIVSRHGVKTYCDAAVALRALVITRCSSMSCAI
jgi:hypothetical protein